MSIIQSAIRAAGGFSAPVVPSVAVHLVGKVKDVRVLQGAAIQLNPALMGEVEKFLHDVGVPMGKGLKVLKSDAAADTLVLTANALEGSGQEVVVKLTGNLGIFEQMPHLKGNALHLDEPMMAAGVQKTFKSALNGSPLLVRVEQKMLPVDKAIDQFAGAKAQEVKLQFTEKMRERVRERGLADMDLKANNFAIAPGGPPVASMEDLLAREIRIIDVGAVKIRSPEVVADMAKPVHYEPRYLDRLPGKVDELFTGGSLPPLSGASGVPATAQAHARTQGGRRE